VCACVCCARPPRAPQHAHVQPQRTWLTASRWFTQPISASKAASGSPSTVFHSAPAQRVDAAALSCAPFSSCATLPAVLLLVAAGGAMPAGTPQLDQLAGHTPAAAVVRSNIRRRNRVSFVPGRGVPVVVGGAPAASSLRGGCTRTQLSGGVCRMCDQSWVGVRLKAGRKRSGPHATHALHTPSHRRVRVSVGSGRAQGATDHPQPTSSGVCGQQQRGCCRHGAQAGRRQPAGAPGCS
jgi:hypothetical protein